MHQVFLKQAVDLAAENVAQGGGPFGALVVKNQHIIAASGNRVSANQDPTAHAEILAIRAACLELQDFQLTECILYTSCEPCPMCLGAIYWARLASVYYACSREQASAVGFDDSFIYQEIAKPPIERHIVMHSLPVEKAEQAFLDWQVFAQKIRY
jgi:guanine deaminase